MQAPFKKLTLIAALGLLCAATPDTHAAAHLKFEGIKNLTSVPGSPEVWQWFVTPLDPAVNGGVSVAVGDVTGDGMDPATVALLLPAVQKVREAAAQWPGTIPLDLTQPLTGTEIGLLLPAVQKVREAAAALPSPATASLMDFTTDVDPLSLFLLLPAVQKVREAALLDQGVTGGPPASDTQLFSLLLPAAFNAAEVADRIQLANRTLPGLLGLPGAGDPAMVFTTGWELQNGLVTLRMDSAPLTAVPEPATWALWLGGLGMTAYLQRRRRALATAATA
jgi:PEP-CTERM motif